MQSPLRLRVGRALGRWLVPQELREAERRLRKGIRARMLVGANRELLAPNADLRGRHVGRRCFVIGNGPSLSRQDLSHLAGEVTFVVNGFWKHPIVELWSPTYYCLADPTFFDGSEACRRFFVELRGRCPTSTLIVPLFGRSVVVEQGLVPASHVRYVAFSGHLKEGFRGRLDLTAAVPYVINVPLLAIMVAMFAGCSPIYLLGLDHDWLAQRGRLGHFFAGDTIENHPKATGAQDAATSYKSLLESQLDLWNSYGALANRAERTGTLILNATDGGFLDVFPRVSYEEVVGR